MFENSKNYVPLEEDINVASIVRLTVNAVLKPQTINVCPVGLKNNPSFGSTKLLEISPVASGYVSTEPGLMISNTVVNFNKNSIRLKRGCVVGKASHLEEINLVNVNQSQGTSGLKKLDESEISVPQEFKKDILRMIRDNEDVFATSDKDLGCTDTVQMTIDTGDHPPIRLKPYRAPLNQRKIIDKTIEELLEANIIRKSRSAWAAPIIIVSKKDKTSRMCVDYRSLNAASKIYSFPLPLIDDLLASVGKAKVMTSLDLKSGYYQVKVKESDKEKTAFVCHKGLFEFNVLPFGLASGPSLFSELVTEVLQGLEHFSTAYIDDILIFSETEEEHLGHIQQVFDRLRQHKLKLKLKKCNFLQNETNYLGFIISKDGLKPDPEKVKAIQGMKAPSNVREVRGLIGCLSYYRRFVPSFSKIAEPIVALTRKNKVFNWTTTCQEAFEKLRDELVKVPLLAYPDLNKPYVLYTDASDSCVGACLTQLQKSPIEGENEVERPIYFLSHKLSDTQTRWSTIEKEAFAIHYALQKLNHYLYNAEFVIKTDHKPLKYILESPMQNKKIQLWALNITGYNCTIQYIPGPQNVCADFMSRLPSDEKPNENPDPYPDISDNTYEINVINSNRFHFTDYANNDKLVEDIPEKENFQFEEFDMSIEQMKDKTLRELKEQLVGDKVPEAVQNKYIIIDDILYYISNVDNDPIIRLYIPSHIKQAVVEQYHDKNGHMGIDKTFDSIRQKYFWPNMFKELYSYVTTCVPCQSRNLQKVRAPIQETKIPPYPFCHVGVDLSGPYPTTMSGNRYIIGFIDLYSGWPEAFTQTNIAKILSLRIIEQTSPVSFILKNQLDGTTTKAHAEQIRLAKLDWEIPNNNQGRALRKAAYVVPIESQSEDSSDDESIDSDTPLNQIAKRYKKERENSDYEDDIPLMELSKKLRGKKIFSEQDNVNNGQLESDDQVMKEKVGNSPSDYDVSDIEDNMSVNSVKIENNQKSTEIGANETKLVSKEHVQNLVRALIGIIMADNEEIYAQLEPLSLWKLLPSLVVWKIYVLFKTNFWREILERKRKERREPLFKEFFAIQKLINQSDPIIIDNYCGLPTKFVEIIGRRKQFAEIHNLSYQEHLKKWTVENFKAIGWLKRSNRFGVYHQEVILNNARKMHRIRIFDLIIKFETIMENKKTFYSGLSQALSFLFDTVSDSDLSKIRRNIKTLAQNQDAIRHIVQDRLTILNTTQTHVSENRHKVNELIESVEELGNRLHTFATDIKIQIEVMGNYL
ncbi:unnamed protein product [Mytilus edulis]|uniref:Reverse transcriptase domain-containing protein n=1 Tax=Mytilus edulis TaxID=6550 RepID=A0A8S3SHE8_MYTED|nr:unnamed protein product [Mytilus edulis]